MVITVNLDEMKVPPLKKPRGFSLVEMLTTISVIGILSAAALPSVSRINQASEQATQKRNAQNLAAVCASAQAAGLNFVTNDFDQTLVAVAEGGEVVGGVFDGSYFGVPGLSEQAISEAAQFLELRNGSLLYCGGDSKELKDEDVFNDNDDDFGISFDIQPSFIRISE